MIQFQRVSIDGTNEIWYLQAAVHKLYQLAEAHCKFDHEAHTANIQVFVAENCPRHKDLVDYFIDHVIPSEYTFMVTVYSRGTVVDGWNSAEKREWAEDDTLNEAISKILGAKAYTA